MSACITIIPKILLQLTEFCKLTVILLKEYAADQNSVKMLYHRSYPAALHIFRRSHNIFNFKKVPKLASFRVKLVNFLSEKGRFSFLLRSLHFGSNRLSIEQQAHDTEKYGVHNVSNLLTTYPPYPYLTNGWNFVLDLDYTSLCPSSKVIQYLLRCVYW